MLREKDIKRITAKQNKDKKMREDFESHIEVYIKIGEKHLTYALLEPHAPRASHKSWSLGYVLAYPDFVMNKEGSALMSWPGPTFWKYRDFKKFLKSTNIIRLPTKEELKELYGIKKFKERFEVTEVEELERLTPEFLKDIDNIFERSR